MITQGFLIMFLCCPASQAYSPGELLGECGGEGDFVSSYFTDVSGLVSITTPLSILYESTYLNPEP